VRLSLPSLEELNGADITYACATNADRNLVCDNIFANILKQRNPKKMKISMFHKKQS
jgi:hypothetical protein